MPTLLDRFRKPAKKKKKKQVYSQDAVLITTLKEVARDLGQTPRAVVEDLVRWKNSQDLRQEKVRYLWRLLLPREQEVTALVCLGYDRKQIAVMLEISPETVKTHLDNIFRKLGVRTTKHLTAIFRGWDFAEWWDNHPHQG